MAVTIKTNTSGLLNLVSWGKVTEKALHQAMKLVVQSGRNEARAQIRSQFRRRTGRLAADAGKIRTRTTVTVAEISGTVGPLPRLLSIFEKGAVRPGGTIRPVKAQALRFVVGGVARGETVFVRGEVTVRGGVIAPRPVVEPTAREMQSMAGEQFGVVLLQAVARGNG